MEEMINNVFYHELGEQWYTACDHPIALLRAENACRNPWIADHIAKRFPGKQCDILDIGCGGGFLTNVLAQEKHHVTGLDISKESLGVAKEKDETHTVTYIQADAYHPPFADESFDVVTSMDFLEHVDEPARVVREAARLLRPGGIFFFHTLNRNPLNWIVAIKGVEWFVKNTPKQMHLYRMLIKPSELKTYCEQSGLTIEKFRGLTPVIDRYFFKLLLTRTVSPQFAFRFCRSTAVSYLGMGCK